MTHPHFVATALAAALVLAAAVPATAQIGRQGERLVDLGKEPVQVTVTDGTETQIPNEQRVTELAVQHYGANAVRSNGRNLPEAVEAAIAEGNPMPEGAGARPIDATFERLLADQTPEGARWVQAGEHLIALDGGNRILFVAYDVLM
ncbi:MAG: hypothetical protein AAFR52_15700 [Pseudomonadota bacterium]